MIDPNLSLAVSLVLTLYYLGYSAWQLWREKPMKYVSLTGELVFVFAIILGMATTMHGIARSLMIAAFLVATTLRLIARHRFAVHDL